MVLMNLFAGRNRDLDTENRLIDTVGAGEGGTNWESSVQFSCSVVSNTKISWSLWISLFVFIDYNYVMGEASRSALTLVVHHLL